MAGSPSLNVNPIASAIAFNSVLVELRARGTWWCSDAPRESASSTLSTLKGEHVGYAARVTTAGMSRFLGLEHGATHTVVYN
jgi:hypothetical protein